MSLVTRSKRVLTTLLQGTRLSLIKRKTIRANLQQVFVLFFSLSVAIFYRMTLFVHSMFDAARALCTLPESSTCRIVKARTCTRTSLDATSKNVYNATDNITHSLLPLVRRYEYSSHALETYVIASLQSPTGFSAGRLEVRYQVTETRGTCACAERVPWLSI